LPFLVTGITVTNVPSPLTARFRPHSRPSRPLPPVRRADASAAGATPVDPSAAVDSSAGQRAPSTIYSGTAAEHRGTAIVRHTGEGWVEDAIADELHRVLVDVAINDAGWGWSDHRGRQHNERDLRPELEWAPTAVITLAGCYGVAPTLDELEPVEVQVQVADDVWVGVTWEPVAADGATSRWEARLA